MGEISEGREIGSHLQGLQQAYNCTFKCQELNTSKMATQMSVSFEEVIAISALDFSDDDDDDDDDNNNNNNNNLTRNMFIFGNLVMLHIHTPNCNLPA